MDVLYEKILFKKTKNFTTGLSNFKKDLLYRWFLRHPFITQQLCLDSSEAPPIFNAEIFKSISENLYQSEIYVVVL